MSVEVGSAYISLLPSMRGFSAATSKALGKQMPAVGNKAGQSLGSRMASAAGRAIKTTAKVGFMAAGVAAGATLVSGFQAAVKRQTSTNVLSGLYGDAKLASQTLKDLRKVSRNSPLDYTSYTKAAESLAYAGVEGKDATGVLENVGKTIVATGGGTEKLDQAMGGVMKAVNNGGIAMMDSLSMISESGAPILAALGEDMGLSIDKVKKLASEGKINVEDVLRVLGDDGNKVMQKYMKAGDMASMGFAQSWAMAKDAVVNAVADNIVPLLDKLAPIVRDVGFAVADWISNADFTPFINAIKGIVNWFKQLDFSSWDNFVKSLSTGGGSEAFASIGKSLQALMPAFREFGVKLRDSMPALAALGGGVLTMVADGLGFLAKHVDKIVAAMPFILGAFVAWRAATALQTKLLALQAPILMLSNAMRMRAAMLELRLAASKTASNTATATGNAVERTSLLTKMRNVAATVAQRTATIASTVATKAAAVGQRLLNAAMRANPIGLIITGIMLLVGALVWFFTKTKLGQAIITAVWSAIKVAIGAVVNWFTGTVVPFFQAAITKLVVGFQVFQMKVRYYWSLFKQVLSVVWNWVKLYVFTPIRNFVTKTIPNAFKFFVNIIRIYINTWKLILTTVWRWVKLYVFTPIKNFVMKTIPNAFKAFVNLIRTSMNGWKRILQLAWSFVRLKVFVPINRFVKVTIPNAFQYFVNAIRNRMTNFRNNLRNIWNWVKDHVFKPMNNFIKETVPNAFKKGVDSIKEFWNKLKKIASKPMKFVIDTVYNKGLRKMWNPIAGFIGKDNWKLDKVDVSKFATGGRVSGPGSSTSDSIPARLSNNEHVLTAKDVKNLGGHSNVYALRRAAASGWTPGLATGGTLIDAANWWVRKGARGSRHPAFGGAVRSGHSRNSLHYQDRAVDLNYGPGGQNATETNFFNRHMAEFKKLYKGIRVIWQSKGHYDHLHIDNSKGADIGNFSGASGGGGGWIPGLDKLVDWVKSKVDNIGGEGRMPEAMRSGAKKLIDGLADKARSVFDVFGGGGGSTTVPDEGVAKAVQNVAANYGWDEGQQWQSLRWLIDKESSWNPNAANPSSSARGLFQKMTSIHGPLESTVEGQARWGLNYIKNRYGDPISAQRWHRSHNWYAKGTLSAARGWATVGEDGPELIKLRGGEQIKSNRNSRRFIQEHTDDNGRVVLNVNFNGRVDDPNEAVNKLQFEVNRLFAGGKYR